MGKLVLAVSNLDSLFHAWRDVRSQVQRSSWPQLSAELGAIDAEPLRTLRTIQKQLRGNAYQFSPKWGYAKRKSGGSRRGITVHCVTDRIVQRSILNVIHARDPRPGISWARSPGRWTRRRVSRAFRGEAFPRPSPWPSG